MAIKNLSIDLIVTDAGTQMRAGTRLETVKEYAEIATGKEWRFDTPITVFFDGVKYYLADGFHRHEACVMAGRETVSADVRKGTLRDAITFALGANQCHGLRRSNDDKRRAVEFVLADPEWSQWSSRAIADLVGVSDMFVGNIRREQNRQVQTVCTSKPDDPAKHEVSEKRIGKDGKEYPATVKAKPIAEETTKADLESTATTRCAGEPEPDAEQYEDVDDEPETVEAHGYASIVRDSLGRDVPENLRAAYNAGVQLNALGRQIDRWKRELIKSPDVAASPFISVQGLESGFQSIKRDLVNAAYWTACPRCHGAGCDKCNGSGFLPYGKQGGLSAADKEVLGL